MAKFVMREDSGASKIITAETIDEALEEAKDWAVDGDYHEHAMVTVYVHELDQDDQPTGQSISGEIMVGPEPTVPDCMGGQEHDWQSPHTLVGGIDSNPGVWSTGGTGITEREVCAHCGIYRTTHHTGSQRNPGELPETVQYEDADERSLDWVSEQAIA